MPQLEKRNNRPNPIYIDLRTTMATNHTTKMEIPKMEVSTISPISYEVKEILVYAIPTGINLANTIVDTAQVKSIYPLLSKIFASIHRRFYLLTNSAKATSLANLVLIIKLRQRKYMQLRPKTNMATKLNLCDCKCVFQF